MQDLTADERIVHLLHRFTPGATPELVADVRAKGAAGWLEAQLSGGVPEAADYTAALKEFQTLGLGLKELFDAYEERPGKNATEEEKREARRKAQIPTRELLGWVILRAVASSQHVLEASCDFLRNHFAVSIEKGEVKFLVLDWERGVIRKNALGSFATLLEATSKHPAMLFFLDNYLSRRPATPEELKALESQIKRRTGSAERAEEAVDIAKQRGLNENYARELMELHTLGVDNGYTQQDVINVAKCLTGWTIARRSGWNFTFDKGMHCPGDKVVLGKTVKEAGVSEGEEVVKRLASSEGCARFLAWKLCRWFVNDQPDDAMVRRIAAVFSSSGGDLAKVYRAIAEDPDFYKRENYLVKFKRPWEFVMSALRATQADVTRPGGIEQALMAMNEALYRCADPTGYYDQAEAWRDPGAMATRWSFANDLVGGRIAGAHVPSSLYAGLAAEKPRAWRSVIEKRLLPVAGLGERSAAAIDKRIAEELQKDARPQATKLGAAIAAMILGSPEFQKQ